MNGFFEVGSLVLVAFAFVNVIFGAILLQDTPPIRRRIGFTQADLKELEAGIPVEGAELVTPRIEKKVHVG